MRQRHIEKRPSNTTANSQGRNGEVPAGQPLIPPLTCCCSRLPCACAHGKAARDPEWWLAGPAYPRRRK